MTLAVRPNCYNEVLNLFTNTYGSEMPNDI